MERLLSVEDIMDRYQFKSRQTASKRMHEMDTLMKIGRKVLVPEGAVHRYDQSKATHPPEIIRAAMRMQRRK